MSIKLYCRFVENESPWKKHSRYFTVKIHRGYQKQKIMQYAWVPTGKVPVERRFTKLKLEGR